MMKDELKNVHGEIRATQESVNQLDKHIEDLRTLKELKDKERRLKNLLQSMIEAPAEEVPLNAPVEELKLDATENEKHSLERLQDVVEEPVKVGKPCEAANIYRQNQMAIVGTLLAMDGEGTINDLAKESDLPIEDVQEHIGFLERNRIVSHYVDDSGSYTYMWDVRG